MAKVGINLKIDVSKITKERLYRGQKGVYLDATVFVDLDELDQYGQSGMITQSWKDQQKGEGNILGNAKVFWKDQSQAPQQAYQQPARQPQNNAGGFGSHAPQQHYNERPNAPVQQGSPIGQGGGFDNFDDDIPFN